MLGVLDEAHDAYYRAEVAAACIRWSRKNLHRFLPVLCLRTSTDTFVSCGRKNCSLGGGQADVEKYA
jgi:hypothetical protein